MAACPWDTDKLHVASRYCAYPMKWIWVQVVYLSATSFLDKRTENEARKKFDAAAKAR